MGSFYPWATKEDRSCLPSLPGKTTRTQHLQPNPWGGPCQTSSHSGLGMSIVGRQPVGPRLSHGHAGVPLLDCRRRSRAGRRMLEPRHARRHRMARRAAARRRSGCRERPQRLLRPPGAVLLPRDGRAA
ncbi:MAG: hypothetical protein MZV64_28145 [Ignavibacteriales bacterium]|nr:hypothetical protein [Ignavibacteriales bacterium]